MNKFFYYLSKTDAKLIKGCTNKARYAQAAYGFFVLLTGIIAFFVGAYALKMAWGINDYRYIAGGLIYCLFIMFIDREIVAAKNKKAALLRIPLAFAIGWVLSVPLELTVLEGRIQEHLADEQGKKNAPNLQKKDAEILRLNTVGKELQEKFNHHDQQVQYWAEIMDQELAGRQVEGRTKKSGPGPVYDNAKLQWEEEKAARDKAKTAYDSFMDKKPTFLKEAAIQYKEDYHIKSNDLLSHYIALQQLKNNDEPGNLYKAEEAKATRNMAWGITIILIVFELVPALMKLFRDETDYDQLLTAQAELNRGIIFLKTNQQLDKIESNPGAFIKPDALELILAQMEVMR